MLELALVGLLVMGLASFLTRPLFMALIGVLGGLFLLWMGLSLLWDVFKHKPLLNLGAAACRERSGGLAAGKLVGLGAAVSLANPYWILWWATAGFAYLTVALQLGLAGVVAFYTGHILGDFLWYSAVAWMVASGQRFLGPGFYRLVLGLSGVFLLALAGYFLVNGLRYHGAL
ncbi:LysE family transporter [Desulfothermobacter acidiphilus]|uniref:LysE family transporter n=1 Tax=Desulfothermobacter acidiphilus TaxID=1938353 RepID=UPI003F8C2295